MHVLSKQRIPKPQQYRLKVGTYYRKSPIPVLKQPLAIKSEYNSIPMYSDHTLTSRHFTKNQSKTHSKHSLKIRCK